MRFRCIAVEREHINLQFHNQDGELGFYKFYYQLLHHWIQDFNEYNIYCDVKKNRDPLRLHTLKKYLDASNISSTIKNIQSLPSRELVLIQFCDFLLGAASSRMNNMLRVGSAKEAVVQYLEKSLEVEKLIKTVRDEQKFNVFKIRLKGGGNDSAVTSLLRNQRSVLSSFCLGIVREIDNNFIWYKSLL